MMTLLGNNICCQVRARLAVKCALAAKCPFCLFSIYFLTVWSHKWEFFIISTWQHNLYFTSSHKYSAHLDRQILGKNLI